MLLVKIWYLYILFLLLNSFCTILNKSEYTGSSIDTFKPSIANFLFEMLRVKSELTDVFMFLFHLFINFGLSSHWSLKPLRSETKELRSLGKVFKNLKNQVKNRPDWFFKCQIFDRFFKRNVNWFIEALGVAVEVI